MYLNLRSMQELQSQWLLPCIASSAFRELPGPCPTFRFFNTHHIRAKRIKRAAEARCELCGKEEGLDDLEIHSLIDEEAAEKVPLHEREPFLLVLCSRCHHDLHRFSAPPDEQQILIQTRRENIRQKIRDLLSYVPRSYTPPDSDMEEVYRDACSSRFRFGT